MMPTDFPADWAEGGAGMSRFVVTNTRSSRCSTFHTGIGFSAGAVAATVRKSQHAGCTGPRIVSPLRRPSGKQRNADGFPEQS